MKKILKFCFMALIFITVLPFGLIARWCHRLFNLTFAFDFFAQAYSLTPGFFGPACRVCFYMLTLEQCHWDVFFGFGSFISKINTRIGKGVLINGHTTVGLADIGDGVVIANYVSVLSGGQQHNFDDPESGILSREGTYTRVKIGNDTFVGDQSVVMTDIGEKCIVGAGSIVIKPIPAYSIAVGNPCKVVRSRK